MTKRALKYSVISAILLLLLATMGCGKQSKAPSDVKVPWSKLTETVGPGSGPKATKKPKVLQGKKTADEAQSPATPSIATTFKAAEISSGNSPHLGTSTVSTVSTQPTLPNSLPPTSSGSQSSLPQPQVTNPIPFVQKFSNDIAMGPVSPGGVAALEKGATKEIPATGGVPSASLVSTNQARRGSVSTRAPQVDPRQVSGTQAGSFGADTASPFLGPNLARQAAPQTVRGGSVDSIPAPPLSAPVLSGPLADNGFNPKDGIFSKLPPISEKLQNPPNLPAEEKAPENGTSGDSVASSEKNSPPILLAYVAHDVGVQAPQPLLGDGQEFAVGSLPYVEATVRLAGITVASDPCSPTMVNVTGRLVDEAGNLLSKINGNLLTIVEPDMRVFIDTVVTNGAFSFSWTVGVDSWDSNRPRTWEFYINQPRNVPPNSPAQVNVARECVFSPECFSIGALQDAKMTKLAYFKPAPSSTPIGTFSAVALESSSSSLSPFNSPGAVSKISPLKCRRQDLLMAP